MTGEDPWAELRRRARRAMPRYDVATCGRCGVCGLGPTTVLHVPALDWWARCDVCEVRWPLGPAFDFPSFADSDDDASIEPSEDDTAELIEDAVGELAGYTDLTPEPTSAPSLREPQWPAMEMKTMKTNTKTIRLDLPASVDALITGLEPRTVHPQLAEAERQVSRARAGLGQALAAAEACEVRVKQASLSVAGGADPGLLLTASAELAHANAVVPGHRQLLQQAEQQLQAVTAAAAIATRGEAERRQAILTTAAAALIAELERLAALEDALHEAAARIPNVYGGGVFMPGTFRDRVLLTVPR